MLSSARRTLVTGASRPVGLEMVRQCLERGDRVIATARNPARVPILADLRAKYGTLDLVALDPADAASVAEAIPILESITTSIDLLLIAPGDPGPHERTDDTRASQIETVSATDLVEHFRRYAVAPLLLVRTLLPMLREAGDARVLFVSEIAILGSGDAGDAQYALQASRVALDTMVRLLATELAQCGVTVASALAGSDASVTSRGSADDALRRLVDA